MHEKTAKGGALTAILLIALIGCAVIDTLTFTITLAQVRPKLTRKLWDKLKINK